MPTATPHQRSLATDVIHLLEDDQLNAFLALTSNAPGPLYVLLTAERAAREADQHATRIEAARTYRRVCSMRSKRPGEFEHAEPIGPTAQEAKLAWQLVSEAQA